MNEVKRIEVSNIQSSGTLEPLKVTAVTPDRVLPAQTEQFGAAVSYSSGRNLHITQPTKDLQKVLEAISAEIKKTGRLDIRV